MYICMFLDNNPVGEKKSCKSIRSFMICINSVLVQRYSKRHSTVKTTVFEAEFVAMKEGIDAMRGLHYKLRMMGISISGLSCIFANNISVLHNTSRPESVLKKSNLGCNHAVCRLVARGDALVGHIPCSENVANLMTNITNGSKHVRDLVLTSNILFENIWRIG